MRKETAIGDHQRENPWTKGTEPTCPMGYQREESL